MPNGIQYNICPIPSVVVIVLVLLFLVVVVVMVVGVVFSREIFKHMFPCLLFPRQGYIWQIWITVFSGIVFHVCFPRSLGLTRLNVRGIILKLYCNYY
jgi:hypothetical protein